MAPFFYSRHYPCPAEASRTAPGQHIFCPKIAYIFGKSVCNLFEDIGCGRDVSDKFMVKSGALEMSNGKDFCRFPYGSFVFFVLLRKTNTAVRLRDTASTVRKAARKAKNDSYVMDTTGKKDFEKLFREHYSQCYFLAFRMVGDEEVSRDIVSESFAALWNRRNEVEQAKLLGYLLVSVRNRAVNWLRQRNRMETVGTGVLERISDDGEAQWLLREQRIAAVEEVIGQLPERTRHVLEQCYYFHRTYAEVADELGISVSGVKKHIMKALATLRQHFNTDKHQNGT